MNYRELAKQIIENNYFVVGVRGTYEDEQYKIGDVCRESYDWDFENDCSTYYTTGETANGTCATHVDTQYFETEDEISELAQRIEKTIKQNAYYGEGQQVIIAGNQTNNDGAFDPGEIRIVDARVIAIVD
ncbi:hypothetical protein WD019_15110 [Fictibacillus sp. Mic-4]|uniref:hypothetical protein n=1 Tax=Fictibacillus sp. Mic-4 TaxID=3132826 RepID=UPI003CECD9B0